MTWLTKANRAQLEQNLRELNRDLAQTRVDRDEESVAILEAQDKIRDCGLTRQQKTFRRLGDVKQVLGQARPTRKSRGHDKVQKSYFVSRRAPMEEQKGKYSYETYYSRYRDSSRARIRTRIRRRI